jgi:hypothetical protein
MAADILQFVDSVSATAALRLDVNDGVTWILEAPSVDFSPPPLQRALAGTLLTDGQVQSGSSYGNRTLRCTLSLTTSPPSADTAATQHQILNRELDRDFNIIKWQPAGATSPVFFRTMRSPVTAAHPISPLNTSGVFAVEILAEPFALGLREDVAVVTVNNDPAAGSNGLFFDVSGVKGDVDTPAVIECAAASQKCMMLVLGVRQHGTPSDLLHFVQAESLTLGTDTTNPGGGPDATMSGATLNNFVRTSFATDATMVWRTRFTLSGLTAAQRQAIRGTFRLFAVVRRSVSTDTIKFAVSADVTASGVDFTGLTQVTFPAGGSNTVRTLVDLGLVNLNRAVPAGVGYATTAQAPAGIGFTIGASRTGTGTLDWDYVMLVPADESLMLASNGLGGGTVPTTWVLDGVNESSYFPESTASPFAGTVGLQDAPPGAAPYGLAGGFPQLRPNHANRIIMTSVVDARAFGVSPLSIDKTVTMPLTVSYWPRYLYIRPATT